MRSLFGRMVIAEWTSQIGLDSMSNARLVATDGPDTLAILTLNKQGSDTSRYPCNGIILYNLVPCFIHSITPSHVTTLQFKQHQLGCADSNSTGLTCVGPVEAVSERGSRWGDAARPRIMQYPQDTSGKDDWKHISPSAIIGTTSPLCAHRFRSCVLQCWMNVKLNSVLWISST